MSVRSSHPAGCCTSHCFWAKSQRWGHRKVLDEDKPNQGQTEERGTAGADFCPDESAATAFPLQALGHLPSSSCPQHLFQGRMEGMRTDKTSSRYREAGMGHAAA